MKIQASLKKTYVKVYTRMVKNSCLFVFIRGLNIGYERKSGKDAVWRAGGESRGEDLKGAWGV